MKICSVEGCEKHLSPGSARGLCDKHYARWRKHGDNFERGHIHATNGDGERFLRNHVKWSGDDCLLYPFGKSMYGYGICSVGGTKGPASRHMCRLAHGEPPFEDAHAAHACGNRACVNPRHLRWATAEENAADKEIHGTLLRGSEVGNSRLTAEQAIAIYSDDRPVSEIAKEHSCTTGHVWTIKRGITWAHATGHKEGDKPRKGKVSPSRVLTDEQVRAIYLDQRSGPVIAKAYGCSSGLVYFIKNGKARRRATQGLRADEDAPALRA